jgi:tetratricopeptide (TPR) repeat protein
MSLEQAAAFGESALLHASKNEPLPAVENLDRGIAILEKFLRSSNLTEVEKSNLRARLYDFLSRKADLLLSSGGTSAALHTSLLMCSTDPRNATGFFISGQALRKLKRYDQAVDYLTTASKLDPSNAQIKQCLELAITELRMPSSVELMSSTPEGTKPFSSSSATTTGGRTSNNSNNNSELDPFDVDSILRYIQRYVPTAIQIKKYAREKPANAAGIVLGILVVLSFLISFATVMFCLCFGIVVALHKWEKNRNLKTGSISSYRVPMIDVPLNVLTSAFLAISGVYFLLL